MWDVKACRGCLAVKGKLEKIGEAMKRVYSALTDVSITECDGYPNYFCLECRTQIKKCLAFRRKSRRAHFVLKEIMSVRKQVTYSDIVTVNRRKTNLESSLNYWDPQKCGYVVINTDGDVEEVKTETNRAYSTRIVDINPSIVTVEAALPVEKTEPPEEPQDFPENISDTDFGGEQEEPIPDGIDLNDVFKDLEDEKSDCETVVDEPVETKRRKKVVNEEEDSLMMMVRSLSLKAILDALELHTVKVLDVNEQKLRLDIRRSQGPFASAFYKCSMCVTVHEDMDQLVKHVANHNSRREGEECVVCKNKYTTTELLNKHIAQCHLYEYSCRCGHTSYCLYDAVKHSQSINTLHKKNSRLERRISLAATLQTFSMTALSQQMMGEVLALRSMNEPTSNPEPPEDTKDQCKCDICGVWMGSVRDLERHMVLQHRYLYTCKECKEVCTTRSAAVEHAAAHNEQHFQCEHCGIEFEDEKKRKGHRCPEAKPVPCNLCGLSFKTGQWHLKHQMMKHGYLSLNDPRVGDPQYKCADCHVQFVNKKSYETHVVLTSHAGADSVEFACVPCKKLFEDEEQMETHFVTCGRNKKYPRKCCYCEKVLTDSTNYKLHYIHEHPTLQYRYTKGNTICELCGRMVHKRALDAHMRAHSRPAFECRHCGAADAAAAGHVTHVLSAHAARPYRCQLCARRFQHRSKCKDHILNIHAPTKLYKCEFCGMEFSYFKHLKDHSESKHSLVIPSLRTFPKKSKSRVYVYAHMQIEINEKEREAVEKCEVAMLDYLDQKSKVVDYKDFFVFKTDPDEHIVRLQTKKKKKKKPKIKIESDVVIKPGEVESDVVIKPGETEEAVRQIEDVKEETKMELKEESNEESAMNGLEDAEDGGEQAMEVDGGNGPLEVFEDDGNQYVMIGDEMYRIANDEEE